MNISWSGTNFVPASKENKIQLQRPKYILKVNLEEILHLQKHITVFNMSAMSLMQISSYLKNHFTLKFY